MVQSTSHLKCMVANHQMQGWTYSGKTDSIQTSPWPVQLLLTLQEE